MKPKKISIIGAGNVGREVAAWCAMKELGNIVLWNRTKETAIGNALDLMEAAPLIGYNVEIKGTGNIKDTKNSDVIVFTAGLPRKPGMTREDLIKANTKIISPLIKKLVKLSPKAVIIMVTNPLDNMSYVALKSSKFPRNRVIGMGGILDSSRFESFIAKELKVSVDKVHAFVLGSHGENMIPLPRLAKVGNKPLQKVLSKKKIQESVDHTKKAGLEIVKLLKANASFSVGASTAKLVNAIIKDKNQLLPCSAYLKGEYGISDTYIGVPCRIGKKGINKIQGFKLNPDELQMLQSAAYRIKQLNKNL